MKRRLVSVLFVLSAFSFCLSLAAGEVSPAPAASDSSTPLPEQGRVMDGRYRNAYFGLSYPLPAGWKEQPAGRLPADDGSYVLTRFALYDGNRHQRASGSLAARDHFFSAPLPMASQWQGEVEIESGPDEVMVGGRTFSRVGYASHGLHWRVFTTDVRCHTLTFTFSGTDATALDAAEATMNGISLKPADMPHCLTGYAQGENIVDQSGPYLLKERFDTIPVRIIIGSDGQVKHVHLLSAFPDESQAIIGALRNWHFKPFLRDGKAVPIETGLVFGIPHALNMASSSP